jgi:hypothetical protein
MQDKRANDRRKKNLKVKSERRMGPRRLVCVCGGKIDVKIVPGVSETFVCLRCGKIQ